MLEKLDFKMFLIIAILLMPTAGVSAESLPAAGGEPAVAAGTVYESGLVKVSSWIERVTVYSDRALVTRRANVHLKAGESRLRFSRLPGNLDADSVQVKGKGQGTIKGVSLEYVPPAGAEDEDLSALTAKERQLQESLLGLQDAASESKKERDLVEAIAKRLTATTEKSEPGELNPQKWVDMVAFYRRRLTALDQEIRAGSPKQIKLQEELKKIQGQIQQLSRNAQMGKQQAEVVVNLPENGELSLDLNYVVMGPRWVPHYDLRADSHNDKMQVVYQAMVSQSTGEDWNGVELTLSTAQPRAGAQHPELQPWRLDVYHEPAAAPVSPKMARNRNLKAAMAPAPAAMAAMAAAPLQEQETAAPEMAIAQATVENQASAVVFTAGGRQTVVSNNQPHRVTVAVLDFPAVFRYSAVPKLIAGAFLQAKIKNESGYPLLAGQTSVFLDNTFVANGNIKTVAPGEEIEAFLGLDDGIKVEHKLLQRQEQKDGLFNGRTKWLYEYRIKLTNHKAKAYDMVVKDQLPIPGNSEIQVELLEPAIKDGDDQVAKDNQNFLEWHRRLEPGKAVELPLKFSISFPKEMRVEGL